VAHARIRADQLCAWYGTSLLITDARGSCGASLALSGYYQRETRHLSRCVLLVNGERPWLCEASEGSPDELRFLYVYPEVTSYGGGGSGQSGDDVARNAVGIPQRALLIETIYGVTPGALRVRADVVNVSRERVTCELSVELDADFADIQEAQTQTREQTAAVDVSPTETGLALAYLHERLRYRTIVGATPLGAWDQAGRRLVLPLALEPGGRASWQLTVEPDQQRAESSAETKSAYAARWRDTFTRVTAPGNREFEAVVDANISDVGSFPLLDGPRDEWLALQAGVPLYPAFFGRDALTAGWQSAMIDRGQALDAALTRLQRHQSNRVDDWHDEEPGRIPYQMRAGPLALLDINPYRAYYADFASPLMFVISLANLCAWTGDTACLDRHWDAARRILDWARDFGDRDGDGYLEYETRSSKGTKNQGWKDSGDAIVYDDGSIVPTPIATCELQGYWYAAQQLMGLLCSVRGDFADGRAHLAAADDLKTRFNRDWWSAREACIGVALDPDKRLIEAPTSNVGHCLAAGIVDRERLAPVVGRLFAPDMFSGWGIRTLSSGHAFYDPLSYHRGSVWAVEQGTIAFGLRRFGFDARALDLAEALFALARLYPRYRIPETVGGYSRRERATPGAYPQANAPQLWNASAFPLVLQSLLGLVPWAPQKLLLVDPILPAWLPEVVLHDLRVGEAMVTLRAVRSADGSSDYEVIRKTGTLHVLRQPPPESLAAGIIDRVAAVAGSIFG
jgi:glycogen debranching enzyme